MNRRAGARLFVALDLPGSVRDELAAWARAARGAARDPGAGSPRPPGPPGRSLPTRRRPALSTPLRPLEAELLHVTLCFLGQRAVADIPAIADLVTGAGGPLAPLSLGAPVWLPPRRPRLLAVAVHDQNGALADLQASLVAELARVIDWTPERRRFRAHVTVARMREGATPALPGLGPTPAREFLATALTLYRSWLAPTGASYEALARVALC